MRLFNQGDRALRPLLPRFDLGNWGRYELGGGEAPYGYMKLQTNFLGTLCKRTGRREYCAYAQRFAGYLKARGKPGGGGGGAQPSRCGVLGVS